ncbi:ROK family protein, partial [uncultured Muriicola sp.]|uniref:ROK family protein n=1 Tax=uncultured Muriicola sp. TaxID=1583102 RepID=UPI00260E8C9E
MKMEKKVRKEGKNLLNDILAMDVGGSSIKSGLVSGETVEDIRTTPIDSKGDSETIITTFSDIINGYTAANHISGIAFSMPGPFDHTMGISYMGPNQGKYEAIYGINLKELLLERVSTDYPITFRDDGESAIVGEALYGAGKPYERLLGVTLGTGIGSAYIIKGEPQYAGKGIPENLLYDCLWENKRADEVFSIRGLKSRLAGVGFRGEPKEATELARTNHEVRKVFELWGEELGLFLNKYVSQFNAQAVIVQGGLAG